MVSVAYKVVISGLNPGIALLFSTQIAGLYTWTRLVHIARSAGLRRALRCIREDGSAQNPLLRRQHKAPQATSSPRLGNARHGGFWRSQRRERRPRGDILEEPGSRRIRGLPDGIAGREERNNS